MPPASDIQVIKRNGNKEPLDLDKIHKVLFWACEDLTGVSVSEIELRAQLQFSDGITTSQIHETIIRAASDLISEDTPNYQYVAARLINYHLRKEVYGGPVPFSVKDLVVRNVQHGVYDSDILTSYDDDDFEAFESIIKHKRDFDLSFVAMEQFRGKYLVRNRVTNEFFETPQMAYLLIAATMFINEDKSIRMDLIKEYYDIISTQKVSLPTPIMAKARKPTRQFSSCVLVSCDDTMKSIEATTSSIYRYISNSAGLGIEVGSIRALGAEIRGGDAESTGLLPFIRSFQSAVKSCSQGGIRGGAATISYPFWHYEFESLIVLKNNKGTEMNRIRQLDYCVQLNRLAYKRLISKGEIHFFSPEDVPDLAEAFYSGDNDLFETLYEKYENDPTIRKQSMSAIDVFSSIATERKETGRIYIQNIDHANNHGSFKPELAPIKQTNLCVEIDLPTKPLQHIDDPEGWIALCTLSAINWGKIKKPEDFERPAALAVRALDNMLDYQSYPVKAAEVHTRLFRPLGVGIINFAYFLAKNDKKYDSDALDLVDEYTEAWSYYLIRASIDLAKEKGACEGLHMTKYADGVLPIDTRNKNVDSLVEHQERFPWEELRRDLKTYGIRNSTLMALMPSETSAQIANATNGVEPPRGLVSEKVSKHGVLKQVVPEIHKLKNKYDMLWDQKSPKGYLQVMAVLQKYIDQGISTNVSYNPEHFEEGALSMKMLINDLLEFYKYGGKQLYYHNTYDGQKDETIETATDTVADEPQQEDEVCESCVL
jgi:ribonucleoside-diphosphate reductase alpha chain